MGRVGMLFFAGGVFGRVNMLFLAGFMGGVVKMSLSSSLSAMVEARKRRPTPRTGVVGPVVGRNLGGAGGEGGKCILLGEL